MNPSTSSQPSFQHLLLATEHTEHDRGAEALALAMASRRQQPLNAVLPLVSNAEYEMLAPQLAARAEADAAARHQAVQAAAEQAGVRLDLNVRRGEDLYREIVAEASERAADLIIIRRRGKRGLLANLLIGEMVTKVVAHAPCSVLVVPRDAAPPAPTQPGAVLVGLAPDQPDAALLERAALWAAAWGAPLHLVCVASHPGAQAQAEATVQAAQATVAGTHSTLATSTDVRQGHVHAELLAAAGAARADFIVIGRHGPQPISRAWIGGVAQKVIGLAECPVLVHVPADGAATPRAAG